MNTAKGKLWLEEADPGYPGSSWWHVGDTNLDDLFEPLEGQEVVVTISIVEPTEETSSS